MRGMEMTVNEVAVVLGFPRHWMSYDSHSIVAMKEHDENRDLYAGENACNFVRIILSCRHVEKG
jgi:hypothetical protein